MLIKAGSRDSGPYLTHSCGPEMDHRKRECIRVSGSYEYMAAVALIMVTYKIYNSYLQGPLVVGCPQHGSIYTKNKKMYFQNNEN